MTPLTRGSDGKFCEKPDAARISEIMRGLPVQLEWAKSDYRYNWPQNVYRFDTVTTVAEILRSGRLFSRQRASAAGSLNYDAANPQIIEATKHAHVYARLYFGPRTPMQYNIEDIRPAAAIKENGAHCPVPVFLIFDGPKLLGLEGVSFSNGNMAAAGHLPGTDAEFLENLPWDSIYHRGPMPRESMREIVFHRQAEVLVQDELDLELLREVVCRTGPERDTLLMLLGDHKSGWEDRVRVARTGEDIFERDYYYIDDVQLVQGRVTFRSRHAVRGPFTVSVRIADATTGAIVFEKEKYMPERLKAVAIPLPHRITSAIAEIRIDGHLAYSGVLVDKALYGERSLL